MGYSPIITVAASNSKLRQNEAVDFICSGKNDELTINKAIEKAVEEDKSVYLLGGNYHIDDFYDFGDGGPKAAIFTPGLSKQVAIIGQSLPYAKHLDGVQLYVSKEALDKISDGEYSVIRTKWSKAAVFGGTILNIENLQLVLAHNQKPVRGIDLRRCDRADIKNVRLNAYGDLDTGNVTVPDPAIEGCIGLTMTDGSNNFISRYENLTVNGFYEGIQVGGEHVIMIECAASACWYGYTFGNYTYRYGFNHPITMIKCCDERNVNLPLFHSCGDHDSEGNKLIGGQEVTMISFNIERLNGGKHTPGGKLGDAMRETYPGAFCGRIEYTLQPAWHHTNEPHFKLFENGSGIGFRTINMTHKPVCSTAERLSYYPSLGEQVFDTDLNKLLICIDADSKKWVDVNGVQIMEPLI